MRVLALFLALVPQAVPADTLVAARTIRAQTVLAPEDLARAETAAPGAITALEAAVGMEARVTLYQGRPIRPGDLAPPALVERNQRVALVFRAGGLDIVTEGRALARGGAGELVRVMNLASRSTVFGRVAPDGTVRVGPSH